ncbi:MAG: hypothetical protein CMM01_04530 [Rhodopirellula sp.]|nr:hypothetical protein [Rhodopirellula sp.]
MHGVDARSYLPISNYLPLVNVRQPAEANSPIGREAVRWYEVSKSFLFKSLEHELPNSLTLSIIVAVDKSDPVSSLVI